MFGWGKSFEIIANFGSNVLGIERKNFWKKTKKTENIETFNQELTIVEFLY